MQKGLLIVISAPSGSGKSTVREELMRRENFAYSVSATTRSPREGEQNGVDYWFVTREQFEEKIRNGDMLEHAIYNGNYYGTPLREALQVVESGRNLLLEIEVEGAMNIKRQYPEAVLIMLLLNPLVITVVSFQLSVTKGTGGFGHLRQTDTNLVFQKFADTTYAAVTQVVNIIYFKSKVGTVHLLGIFAGV